LTEIVMNNACIFQSFIGESCTVFGSLAWISLEIKV